MALGGLKLSEAVLTAVEPHVPESMSRGKIAALSDDGASYGAGCSRTLDGAVRSTYRPAEDMHQR